MAQPIHFECPYCQSPYKVVLVEAPATHDRQLLCLSCGGPLKSHEGKFALKYFRVRDGADPDRRKRSEIV